MNHYLQQPKIAQKQQKKASKIVQKHPEIQPNKSLDELKHKEWAVAIQKEIDQFEQAIVEVDGLFKEATTSQQIVSLGTFKLVHDEYQFAVQKLHHLKELFAKYSELQKSAEIKEAEKTQDNNLEFMIMKEREKIEFQYGVASRVLVLIQAYIKLKDQHDDQLELQKHRDYILQKIDKIKKAEEKHTKKIEKHFNAIQIEDPDAPEEIGVEDEQMQEEQDEEESNKPREDLLKLCDSLIVYLSKFEKKEDDQFLQHDLTTFQYFDHIKVAAPFYSKQIDVTIDLIKAKRSFYENAPDTEFMKKEVQQAVKQQEKQVDVTNEQEFPKLS